MELKPTYQLERCGRGLGIGGGSESFCSSNATVAVSCYKRIQLQTHEGRGVRDQGVGVRYSVLGRERWSKTTSDGLSGDKIKKKERNFRSL